MKTTSYNPSPLEVEFAKAIEENIETIAKRLSNLKITRIDNKIDTDNPALRIHILDEDGDKHLLTIKLIQKPDSELY